MLKLVGENVRNVKAGIISGFERSDAYPKQPETLTRFIKREECAAQPDIRPRVRPVGKA